MRITSLNTINTSKKKSLKFKISQNQNVRVSTLAVIKVSFLFSTRGWQKLKKTCCLTLLVTREKKTGYAEDQFLFKFLQKNT
jgi:hypothetical protein